MTGTHAFKTGMQIEEGVSDSRTYGTSGNVNYAFRNGIPTQHHPVCDPV